MALTIDTRQPAPGGRYWTGGGDMELSRDDADGKLYQTLKSGMEKLRELRDSKEPIDPKSIPRRVRIVHPSHARSINRKWWQFWIPTEEEYIARKIAQASR